jgi:beta-alanine degradation protein BauB
MPKDMMKAGSTAPKVILENDKVRVVELNWKKGLKMKEHSHPDYLVYSFVPMRYKSTSPDGKSKIRSMKKGEIQFFQAETHAVLSLGETGRGIVIELK